jgi:pimeloyl-ACP methyl ester carboxylesterase
VILLVHGLGVGARYFRPLAAELGGEARAPDLREPLPIPELAARFAAACEGPGVVVANSMGCQVAAELAVRRPELVEGLVLVGPTVDPGARSFTRHVGRLLVDAWYEPLRLTGIVALDYLAMGPRAVVRQARHALEHRIEGLLPLIEQPAVVVRGAHDPICPADWARAASRLLPHGRLVTIAGAGHAAHFSHPRELATIVTELRGGSRAAAG